MTSAPPTTTPTRSRAARDLVVTWSTGLLFAAVLGLGTAYARGEQFWLVFGAFTACFLAPCIALAGLLLGAGRRVQPDPHLEENIETRWMEKAASGALFDLLPAAAIIAGALGLFELDLQADVALLGVVAFALADGTLRYALLARREA